jgi:hypothetical protein
MAVRRRVTNPIEDLLAAHPPTYYEGAVGKTGGLGYNNALTQNLQNQLSNAAQNWAVGQQVTQSAQSAIATMIPMSMVAQRKMMDASLALPMRVLAKIRSLDLHQDPLRFVVTFENGKQLEFENVDAFPRDEDIARIALDCP